MLNKRILTLVFVVAFVTLLVGCLPSQNETPIITSDPVKIGEVGVDYTYDVDATDPDEDVLTYSLVTKPTGMAINSATGLIKWTPTAKGEYSVVVKVSDGDLDITQSFTITVSEEEEPTPPPPKKYTITATADNGGSISPSGEVKVVKGSNKTFTITPDTDYQIIDVLVDGETVGAVPTYTFKNVKKNHTIHATFEEKTVTIRWLEDAIRYYPDGTEIPNGSWTDDPIPPVVDGELLPPTTLIRDNGGYYFADVQGYYNNPDLEYEGSVVISATGELSGYATYFYKLPTEDNFVGQVDIIIGEIIDWSGVDAVLEDPGDYDGVMVGTYTQETYKFGTEEDVIAAGYTGAILCEGSLIKWLVARTEYTAHK